MKVVCDSCAAVYRIPDDKLVKAINKATCRQCGAKMLIPRPKPDSSVDERTVVTAASPAAVAVPQPSAPIRQPEEPEPTIPASELPNDPEDDLNPGGQRPDQDTELHPPLSVVAKSPDSPSSPPPPLSSPTPRSPPPLPTVIPSASTAMGDQSPAQLALGYVFVGTILAVFGSMVLSAANFSPDTYRAIIIGCGSFLTTAGAFVAMLIVVSSNFGRQNARPMFSLAVGMVLGAFVGGSVFFIHTMVSSAPRANAISMVTPAAVEPEVDPSPTPTEPTADDELTEPPSDVAPEEPAEEPTPEANSVTPASTPAPVTRPRPQPAPTPEPISRPEPEPEPEPAVTDLLSEEEDLIPRPDPRPAPQPATRPKPRPQPAPVSSSSSDDMNVVPMEVIDVMLRNNLEVKKCFFRVKQTDGVLPPRVDVSFTLSTTGGASNITVQQLEWVGTDLERCLGTAVSGITFPPSSGGDRKLNYPFILQ